MHKIYMRRLKVIYNFFCVLILFIQEIICYSLPIGFQRTQGSLKYMEFKSKNFYVYFDDKIENEGQFTLNVLEAAKPVVESWLGVFRNSPLPIIISSTTDNASFANFITDAIELQTLGQGDKNLVLHEYVHSTMYRHFDNILGPAGSALHLLWLPSWWIEGIAESITQSIGSDLIAGIERYQAIHNDWPSFNRLHNLYDGSSFALRGYAVSAGWVSYLLNTRSDSDFLYKIHRDFFYESCPWYWINALLPFKNKLPFDKVLKKYFHKNSYELYADYKNYVNSLWKNFDDQKLFLKPFKNKPRSFGLSGSIRLKGSKIFKVSYKDYKYYESELMFDGIWANKVKLITLLPSLMSNTARIINNSINAVVVNDKNLEWEDGSSIVFYSDNFKRQLKHIHRKYYVSKLLESKKYVIWLESLQNQTRICTILKHKLITDIVDNDIKCYFESSFPKVVEILGEQYDYNGFSSLILIKITQKDILKDKYSLILWLPDNNNKQELPYNFLSKPIAAGISQEHIWILSAERFYRHIKKIDFKGKCIGQIPLIDTPINLFATYDEKLILPIYGGDNTYILKLNPNSVPLQQCNAHESYPSSPILYALHNKGNISFVQAFKGFYKDLIPNYLNFKITNDTVENSTGISVYQSSKTLDISKNKSTNNKKPIKYRWKARHILTVPWIGQDALGYQLGVVSVPLMDHLQNETLRLYLALGLESKFPHTELSFVSTRFWPELKFDVFRYQTWNGYYLDQNKVKNSAYFDERGIRISSSYYLYLLRTQFSLGIKSSKLIHYIGYTFLRDKYLNEAFVSFLYSDTKLPYFGHLFVLFNISPQFINKDYEYNSSHFAINVGRYFAFLNSTLSLQIQTGLTRGKKRMNVEQVYRPLRIYIPQGSETFNNIYFPIYGKGYMFDAVFGNNLLKTGFNWTFPLISNLDKLVKILYLETLYFSALYNYGGAWYGTFKPKPSYFIKSHSYSLNLKSNIKGIKANVGIGTGQVYSKSFDIFGAFSFEALF